MWERSYMYIVTIFFNKYGNIPITDKYKTKRSDKVCIQLLMLLKKLE